MGFWEEESGPEGESRSWRVDVEISGCVEWWWWGIATVWEIRVELCGLDYEVGGVVLEVHEACVRNEV